ncbi:deoxyribonuclease IV [Thermophilibacter immobilis]|uniref:deoxyribonuclease IV n=1 Tax=Thermophilibacter immobilis TaxID=2779519 RepID=UPI0022B63E42|nr:deoxyribonuclease IV [Thermophilibacter immobilis]
MSDATLTTPMVPTLGCHLSVARGYAAMGADAVSIGATTFAFFTRNPRGGNARALDPADVDGLRALMSEHGFGRLVAHAPYTMNLCSQKPETIDFARRAMAGDLERLESLPGNYYNFHPGSHVGQGAEEGIRLICQGLNEVLDPGQATTVLLETMAGKGTEVGRSFEELARIIDGTDHDELLGVCLDTCHVSDAGYDIASDLDGVLDEFDRVIGLGRLRALHLNDSKNPMGAHKDRHEKIGLGTLGTPTFAAVMTSPRLAGLPMILETPNDLAGYAAEIALLRRMAAGEAV